MISITNLLRVVGNLQGMLEIDEITSLCCALSVIQDHFDDEMGDCEEGSQDFKNAKECELIASKILEILEN